MEETVSSKKREFYNNPWFWVIVAVVIFAAIGASNNSSSPATSPLSNSSSDQGATIQAQSIPAQEKPVSSFGDGTFIVNTDIQSGTYKSSGGEYCSYERLSGFGGTTADIIAIANPNGSAIVTIAPTDKGFTSSGCGTWTKISKTSASPAKAPQGSATAPQSAQSDANPTQLYKTPSGTVVDANGNVVLTAEQVQAFEAAGQNLPQIEANYLAILNNTSTIEEVYQNSQGSH